MYTAFEKEATSCCLLVKRAEEQRWQKVDDSTWASAGPWSLFLLCQMRANSNVLSHSQELDAVQALAWKLTGKICGGKLKYLNSTWMSYALGGVTNTYAASNHISAGSGKKLSSWAIILEERAWNTDQENSLFNRSQQKRDLWSCQYSPRIQEGQTKI